MEGGRFPVEVWGTKAACQDPCQPPAEQVRLPCSGSLRKMCPETPSVWAAPRFWVGLSRQCFATETPTRCIVSGRLGLRA